MTCQTDKNMYKRTIRVKNQQHREEIELIAHTNGSIFNDQYVYNDPRVEGCPEDLRWISTTVW